MKTKFLFLIIIFSLLVSCDSKNEIQNTAPLVAETRLNVSYGGNNQQVFDLYLPANRSESKTKTIILVHGGGWTSGDKANMDYAVDIVKQNLPEYAIANVNYRLATMENYAFPMQIEDINYIVSKLKNENYGISDNFGFVGVSAGAHLAMLYSYGYNTDIKMVCSIVGPTDFTDVNYTSNPFIITLFETATGINYTSNPSYYEQLSPLYRINSSAPPTILLYGNTDPLVPTTQGVSIHNKLDQLGIYNEFQLYQGGHGDWPLTDQLDAYTRLINFIKLKL